MTQLEIRRMLRKLRPYTLVEVAWEDAAFYLGERTIGDSLKEGPCLRHSSGYVTFSDPEYIVLAMTDDRGNVKYVTGSDRMVCDTMVLPASLLREITLLRKPVRR